MSIACSVSTSRLDVHIKMCISLISDYRIPENCAVCLFYCQINIADHNVEDVIEKSDLINSNITCIYIDIAWVGEQTV